MLSRALSLATVMLLIGGFAAAPVRAQNLEAGKSPSQIFAGTCTACHKGARGLLKTVAPGSLPGFLRQHYTTSPAMAGVLASYLISNGATDTRLSGGQPKAGKDGAKEGAKEAKQEPRPEQVDRSGRKLRPAPESPEAKPEAEPRSEPRQAARPENEGLRGRKRLARPAETPEGARPDLDGQVPPQVAGERGPDGRKLSPKQQRLSKRGKPGTEDAAAPKAEPKSDSAKVDSGRDESKPESSKPSEKPAEAKPDSAKVEPSGSEAPALRPDPVPAVTPAPPAAAAKPAEPATPKPAEVAAPKSAEPATSGSSEPAAKPQESAPPATAVAPPPAPADQSGPPAPPISR